MTTTNEIIQKLNDALGAMPNTECIKTTEHIGTAIKMLENKRLEEKRAKWLLQQQATKTEDVIFLRRQTG